MYIIWVLKYFPQSIFFWLWTGFNPITIGGEGGGGGMFYTYLPLLCFFFKTEKIVYTNRTLVLLNFTNFIVVKNFEEKNLFLLG